MLGRYPLDKHTIRILAQKELDQEAFREKVEEMKQKIKSRKWWHKLLPFKILIVRR